MLDPNPPCRTGGQLLEMLTAPEPPRTKGLRFSLCKESGWLSGTEWAVRLCCAMWNMRAHIARAVRLTEALRANPDKWLLMMSGSCTCLTKTPLPEHHAPTCVYGALMEIGGDD